MTLALLPRSELQDMVAMRAKVGKVAIVDQSINNKTILKNLVVSSPPRLQRTTFFCLMLLGTLQFQIDGSTLCAHSSFLDVVTVVTFRGH